MFHMRASHTHTHTHTHTRLLIEWCEPIMLSFCHKEDLMGKQYFHMGISFSAAAAEQLFLNI
jgi:hypothetical protein